jgi:hypothetical protein
MDMEVHLSADEKGTHVLHRCGVVVTNPACATNFELANHPAATIGANTSGTAEARAALLQLAQAR